jgi:hypothetical protein
MVDWWRNTEAKGKYLCFLALSVDIFFFKQHYGAVVLPCIRLALDLFKQANFHMQKIKIMILLRQAKQGSPVHLLAPRTLRRRSSAKVLDPCLTAYARVKAQQGRFQFFFFTNLYHETYVLCLFQ